MKITHWIFIMIFCTVCILNQEHGDNTECNNMQQSSPGSSTILIHNLWEHRKYYKILGSVYNNTTNNHFLL